jgi:hypothetical protein
MTISVHIEELVLHGFEARDRHAIAEGLQTELARLLTEHGLPTTLATGANLPFVNGASIEVAPDARRQALGTKIAQSVFGGMSE